jgi:two-component system response regulator FlrC
MPPAYTPASYSRPFSSGKGDNVSDTAVSQVTDNDLVSEDSRTRELIALARRVATADVTVIISGESGTGKEVLSRFIHGQSARTTGPFVAINCAAIPENMLEAVLFGYEKGAFTGAYQSHPGKFEQAQGGTLLLDEISEMDLGLQAKLLRVLQEHEVERSGGQETIPLDVRVVASTNRNLRDEVAMGRFREDLFYRINVFPLSLPRLCDRPADILPLARQLMRRHVRGDPYPELSSQAERCLLSHSWPGNVRELENVMQRALILRSGHVIEAHDICLDTVTDADLPLAAGRHHPLTATSGTGCVLEDGLRSREWELIVAALAAVGGSRKVAAARLGISPRTLRYKLARLREAGMDIPPSLGTDAA